MPRIALVAALEREVSPLMKRWRRVRREYEGRSFHFFEAEHAVLVCGGIGAEAARRATEAVVALYNPATVESVGFAGALDPALKVGTIFTPAIVVDAGDGSRTGGGGREGLLVSFQTVAGMEQKAKLAKAYGAQAVDMEAASVARGALTHGLPFNAVKVISDELGFHMPPTAQFVRSDGSFATAKFAIFAALRPWLWARTIRLGRNSSRAARSLSQHLSQLDHSAEKPSSVEALGSTRAQA
jgi:adenosylhomocysteine nucleosidase